MGENLLELPVNPEFECLQEVSGLKQNKFYQPESSFPYQKQQGFKTRQGAYCAFNGGLRRNVRKDKSLDLRSALRGRRRARRARTCKAGGRKIRNRKLNHLTKKRRRRAVFFIICKNFQIKHFTYILIYCIIVDNRIVLSWVIVFIYQRRCL